MTTKERLGLLRDRRALGLLAMAALMLGVLLGGELYQSDEPATFYNVGLEFVNDLILIGTSVCSVLLVLRMRDQEEGSRELKADVATIRAESRRWREEMAEHLVEIGSAIRRQFELWRLTTAEQEVGLMLLKGFSHKEIARLRRTSEATIRQQAAAVYQKAGLSGRAALSAFFLEDLLSPP
jgi:DNA-binding CsgD family transcriptional regulator